MNQRISQLTPLNAGSFDPTTSWLELIVADLSSSTGFSTVRVRANAVGGAAVGLNQIAFGDASTGAITSDTFFYRDPSTGNISIGHNLANGKLDIKGSNSSIGTNAFYIQNQSSTPIFKVDNGGQVFFDSLRGISSGVINAYGVTLTFPSGGGITSANMIGCYANNSDFSFANNYGIYGAGRVAIGDNTTLGTYGGGVSNYFRLTALGGNYGQALDRFVPVTDGGFMFMQRYTPSLDRATITTPNDKMQIFGDSGWEMPTGYGQRSTFDADAMPPVGAVYSQAEVQAIADMLRETRYVLAAVVRHLGNQIYFADFITGSNKIITDPLNLPGRHRVRFIAGPVPPEITLGQWYYVEDAGQTGTDFQISVSYGGSAMSFSTTTGNASMEVEWSGMNILKS